MFLSLTLMKKLMMKFDDDRYHWAKPIAAARTYKITISDSLHLYIFGDRLGRLKFISSLNELFEGSILRALSIL